jgi:hypothetical protein
MPRARNWMDVNVDQRVIDAGGWIGPFGPVNESGPWSRETNAWWARDEPTDKEERGHGDDR